MKKMQKRLMRLTNHKISSKFSWVAICKLLVLALGFIFSENVYAEKLFDGTDKSNFWKNSIRQNIIKTQFIDYVLEVRNGKLIWSFVPKSGTSTAAITFAHDIEEFTMLQIGVRNAGAECHFRLQCQAFDLIRWTTPLELLPVVSEQLKGFYFDLTDFSICREWNMHGVDQLQFPLNNLSLQVESLQPGKRYTIEITSLDSKFRSFETGKKSLLQLPKTAVPKAMIDVPGFSVEISEDVKIDRAELQLFGQGNVVASSPLKFSVKDKLCSVNRATLEVPEFIFSGNYELRLKLVACSENASAIALCPLKIYEIAQRKTNPNIGNSSVRLHNGVPTLFIDGIPHSAMAYASYATYNENFRNFTEAGINLFTISGTPTDSTRNFSREVWRENGAFDYRQFDERIMMVLRHNPNALIFPRLNLHVPSWWARKHPDEIMKIQMPDGSMENYLDWDNAGGKPTPCWSSETWRKETLECLKKLVRHIENSPYADHIVGYHIASGSTDEWFWSDDGLAGWWDYSKANQEGFRSYLKNKYRTVNALRSAWRQSGVTFENAMIPSVSQRRDTQTGNSFRNPESERNCLDFYDYNAWIVTDTIAYFARELKEMTGKRKAVGVFYGYLYELGGGVRQVNSGHTNLQAILRNQDIDFISSPASYAYRNYGGKGTPLFMSIIDSIKAHGKLWFDENDVRTSLAFRADSWGPTSAGLEGDRWQQRKELAYCIVNGTGQWWFTVAFNRYDHMKLLREIWRLAGIAQEALALDRSAISPYAIVVDDNSLHYLKPGDRIGAEQLRRALPAMSRAGNHLQHYLLSDVKMLSSMKVIVFANAFAPTNEERQEVEKLKSSNRVLVFFNGAGFFKDGRLDLEAAGEFTGIRLKCCTNNISGSFTMEKEGALCRGLEGKRLGNQANTVSPGVYPDDPKMSVIARDEKGVPVIALKRYSDWTAVYCVLPQLPPQFWQNILDLGGVQRYIDTPDMVWTNRSMLAVCVDKPGCRIISLPEKRKVWNLFSGKVVSAIPCQTFEWTFGENETALFQLE